MLEQDQVLRRARVPDIDDTLMGKWKITRFLGMVAGKLHSQHLPDLTLDDITKLNLNHDRVEAPMGGVTDRFSFWVHSFRRLYPEVQSRFEELAAEGVDIYGATGRLNESSWVDLSEGQLRSVRDLMKGIFYTPRGVKTAVSKAHGIYLVLESGQYDEVEVDEDDPRTAEFELKIFANDPRVWVNYIPYWATSKMDSHNRVLEYIRASVEPGLYEHKRETEKPLEEILSDVHGRLQNLQRLSYLRIVRAKAKTQPNDPNSVSRRIHSLIFNKCLKRFDIESNVIRIGEDLTEELPFGLPVKEVFADAFIYGAGFSTILHLRERYPDLGYVMGSLGKVGIFIMKEEAELAKADREITDKLSRLVGLDLGTLQETLEFTRQLGFKIGRLLANPNLQVQDAMNIWNQYLEETSKVRDSITQGHRKMIKSPGR